MRTQLHIHICANMNAPRSNDYRVTVYGVVFMGVSFHEKSVRWASEGIFVAQ